MRCNKRDGCQLPRSTPVPFRDDRHQDLRATLRSLLERPVMLAYNAGTGRFNESKVETGL
jgi:hypothetical protein